MDTTATEGLLDVRSESELSEPSLWESELVPELPTTEGSSASGGGAAGWTSMSESEPGRFAFGGAGACLTAVISMLESVSYSSSESKSELFACGGGGIWKLMGMKESVLESEDEAGGLGAGGSCRVGSTLEVKSSEDIVGSVTMIFDGILEGLGNCRI